MTTIGFTVSNNSNQISESDQYLAKALSNLGFEVIPVHWQRELPSVDQLVIVFRSHWNYPQYYKDFLQWLHQLTVMGIRTINSIDLVRWNSHKSYLLELKKQGIRIPQTFILPNRQITQEELSSFTANDIVVKPLIGASGIHVTKMQRQEVVCWWNDASNQERSRGWMLQAFVEGIQRGEMSLIFFAGAYSHGILKMPATNEFRVNEQYDGTTQRIDPEAWVIQEAKKVLDVLDDMPIYARVDLVINANGELVIMEVELNEPCLYFSLAPDRAKYFAKIIQQQLI